jgi:hypothetical protein
MLSRTIAGLLLLLAGAALTPTTSVVPTATPSVDVAATEAQGICGAPQVRKSWVSLQEWIYVDVKADDRGTSCRDLLCLSTWVRSLSRTINVSIG